jgi:hypothetical protein
MKLKEWGLMRQKPRGGVKDRRGTRRSSKSSPAVDGDRCEKEVSEEAEAATMECSSNESSMETRDWQVGAGVPSLLADEMAGIVDPTLMEPQK